MSDLAFIFLASLVFLGVVLLVTRLFEGNVLKPRQRVAVHLLDGTTVVGVIWQKRGAYLVIRDAKGAEEGSNLADLDGDVIVHVSKVRLIQQLGV